MKPANAPEKMLRTPQHCYGHLRSSNPRPTMRLLRQLTPVHLRPAIFRPPGLEPPARRFYSALAANTPHPSQPSQITDTEFDEEIEKELAKLPAARAQEARRKIRNERRAESSGQAMGRQDSVIIPYIPPYEGPEPDSSRGLWTHLKIGWQKNRLRDAWGQWLGARQSNQNVDSVLSPANRSWMADFVEEAQDSINLAHRTLTSGDFESHRVKKSIHPAMVEFLQAKRDKLLNAFSPSHSITWQKHAPLAEMGEDGKAQSTGRELEVVAMRAAPVDKIGTIVQIAVRFRSLQSLEIRDERGLLVFGSHAKPQRVMEYYVFQKRMGQVDQPFLLFQQVEEDTKPECMPV